MNTVEERSGTKALSLQDRIQDLQSNRVSGRWGIRSPNRTQWSLYFFVGRLVWATGGSHPEQRWFRLAAQHLSHLDPLQLKCLTRQAIGSSGYSVLLELLHHNFLDREAAITWVREVVVEILFDLFYEESLFSLPGSEVPLDYTFNGEDRQENPISLLRTSEVCDQATNQLEQWHRSPLGGYSPNTAPVIRHPTVLQQQVSPQQFKLLSGTINGKHSLRNLSLLLQKDLVQLADFLQPWIETNLIQLDYEQEQLEPQIGSVCTPPTSHPIRSPDFPCPPPASAPQPLITCIDDSPIICSQLEQVLTPIGLRFQGIQDPTQAVPLLLKTLPDLIFLDLVMPVTNGYEICAQIRRTRKLRDVPVVILTANTGLIFQARARMVGSTDYLTKPIDLNEIMEILKRYLCRER